MQDESKVLGNCNYNVQINEFNSLVLVAGRIFHYVGLTNSDYLFRGQCTPGSNLSTPLFKVNHLTFFI